MSGVQPLSREVPRERKGKGKQNVDGRQKEDDDMGTPAVSFSRVPNSPGLIERVAGRSNAETHVARSSFYKFSSSHATLDGSSDNRARPNETTTVPWSKVVDPFKIRIKHIPEKLSRQVLINLMKALKLPQPDSLDYIFGTLGCIAEANFANAEDATAVYAKLNGLRLYGSTLSVEYQQSSAKASGLRRGDEDRHPQSPPETQNLQREVDLPVTPNPEPGLPNTDYLIFHEDQEVDEVIVRHGTHPHRRSHSRARSRDRSRHQSRSQNGSRSRQRSGSRVRNPDHNRRSTQKSMRDLLRDDAFEDDDSGLDQVWSRPSQREQSLSRHQDRSSPRTQSRNRSRSSHQNTSGSRSYSRSRNRSQSQNQSPSPDQQLRPVNRDSSRSNNDFFQGSPKATATKPINAVSIGASAAIGGLSIFAPALLPLALGGGAWAASKVDLKEVKVPSMLPKTDLPWPSNPHSSTLPVATKSDLPSEKPCLACSCYSNEPCDGEIPCGYCKRTARKCQPSLTYDLEPIPSPKPSTPRCQNCQKRKVKCDGQIPCNQCKRSEQECVRSSSFLSLRSKSKTSPTEDGVKLGEARGKLRECDTERDLPRPAKSPATGPQSFGVAPVAAETSGKVVVLFDFVSANTGMLLLREGELLSVLGRGPEGWLLVENGPGEIGWISEEFVGLSQEVGVMEDARNAKYAQSASISETPRAAQRKTTPIAPIRSTVANNRRPNAETVSFQRQASNIGPDQSGQAQSSTRQFTVQSIGKRGEIILRPRDSPPVTEQVLSQETVIDPKDPPNLEEDVWDSRGYEYRIYGINMPTTPTHAKAFGLSQTPLGIAVPHYQLRSPQFILKGETLATPKDRQDNEVKPESAVTAGSGGTSAVKQQRRGALERSAEPIKEQLALLEQVESNTAKNDRASSVAETPSKAPHMIDEDQPQEINLSDTANTDLPSDEDHNDQRISEGEPATAAQWYLRRWQEATEDQHEKNTVPATNPTVTEGGQKDAPRSQIKPSQHVVERRTKGSEENGPRRQIKPLYNVVERAESTISMASDRTGFTADVEDRHPDTEEDEKPKPGDDRMGSEEDGQSGMGEISFTLLAPPLSPPPKATDTSELIRFDKSVDNGETSEKNVEMQAEQIEHPKMSLEERGSQQPSAHDLRPTYMSLEERLRLMGLIDESETRGRVEITNERLPAEPESSPRGPDLSSGDRSNLEQVNVVHTTASPHPWRGEKGSHFATPKPSLFSQQDLGEMESPCEYDSSSTIDAAESSSPRLFWQSRDQRNNNPRNWRRKNVKALTMPSSPLISKLRSDAQRGKPDEAQRLIQEANEGGKSDDIPREDTPTEHAVRNIVGDALSLDAKDIPRDRNIFQLGIDSLGLVRMSALAKKKTLWLDVDEIMEFPSIRGMAEVADYHKGLQTQSEAPENISEMETTTEGNLVASTESGDEEALVRDEVHFFPTYGGLDVDNWEELRDQLPEDWQWDVEYHQIHSDADVPRGSWTCTPMEADVPKNVPLTIGGAPVVIPVEYQWPPLGGAVNPPPDPRPSSPLDCTAKLELDVIRDIFLTFGGSIGMYVLVNGLLQILVPEDFDTTWASSHLPHKYGGLKVCYITQSMDATMIPAKTETKSKAVQTTQTSTMSSIFSQLTGRPTHNVVSQPLQLNDFIEARMKSTLRKEKFAGRIGLRVAKDGESKLLMSSHVITEAILGRSHRPAIFRKEPYEVLERDWNEQVEIWAGNEKVGTIEKTFDPQAELYPEGFVHDLTVIKPLPSAVNILSSITSPIPDLGWLSRETWNCLRRQVTPLKILSDTDINRRSKTLKCAIPSEILVVGEGIFLRQSLPPTKPSRAQPREVWEHFISRALLYRVSPDFDPPDGHSGIALYGEGLREDGTTGPGIAGFQSFVQRSGPVQASFDMPEVPLNHRLKKGRVSFYGSFVVPEEIRKEYRIV